MRKMMKMMMILHAQRDFSKNYRKNKNLLYINSLYFVYIQINFKIKIRIFWLIEFLY